MLRGDGKKWSWIFFWTITGNIKKLSLKWNEQICVVHLDIFHISWHISNHNCKSQITIANYKLQLQITNHKLHITNNKLHITYYKLQITNYKLQITNYKLQITNHKSQITHYKLQITNYKLQTTNYKLQITNLFIDTPYSVEANL